jgi:UDP-glucose 4-epimerase
VRALVTGGAGFIGSHLVERLLADGARVTVLDDLSTGSLDNLAAVARHERFDFRLGSVTDAALVAELVDRHEIVVHLAAAVGVRLVVEQPVRTIETNVRGSETVLEAAARESKLVLLASTSEVYGKSTKVPFAESDDLVLGPTSHSRWSYACSKALDEWLALAYAHERGTPVVVARLFNTVGPRQTGRYGMVLPTFARQALAGEPLTVHGTGGQSRCFAHVRDVVEALVRLLATPAAVGEVFNVGADEEVTIERLAELVRAAAGSSSPIRHLSYEEAYARGFEDMPRRVPDVAKLERTIGFRPRTSLAEIVADVLADSRQRLATP